jgi:putative ABC transport system permease protein
MGKDVLYALRVLRKSPHFTITAIAILALGIGANSAMFSLVYSVLLRPLPYHEPGRIAVILGSSPQRSGTFPLPPADFLDYRARSHGFTTMAAAELWSPSLTGEGEAEELPGVRTSAALFDVFGVHAALGRTFEPKDERVDAAPLVVIGAGLWKRRFGGDPSVIGRRVLLNREPYIIAGVLPEGFYFPPFWGGRTEIYTPLQLPPAKAQNRQMSTLRIFARLSPGITWEQAKAEVAGIARNLAAEYPNSNAEKSAVAIPLPEISTGKVRTSLLVLLAAVGCILLIACANLANLSLARATGRRKEISIRQALGAGRAQLIRQLLTESVLVSLSGGALGLVLAMIALRAFLADIPGAGAFPRQNEVGVGLPVGFFNFAICLVTALAFGLLPALRSTAHDLNHGLKQAARGTTGDRAGLRIRNLLVGAEIAIALVLLAGAGLLIASFRNLRAIDAGFDAHHVVAISTAVAGSGHADPDRRAAFYREAVERLRALPGVVSASAVNHAPMVGDMWSLNVTVEGKPAPKPGNEPNAVYRVAMPGYFRTMGMKLARGRDFDDRDREGAPSVAIVNETMVRRLWPNEDPIGKRFRIKSIGGEGAWRSVVGVLRDARQWGWSDATLNEMYIPYAQDPSYQHGRMSFLSMMLVVKTAPPPAGLGGPIRAQLRSIDPDVPVTAIQSMEQVMGDAVWQQRMEMSVLSGFASLALVLAVVGIYAVMSYVVGGRTQEIGIRMALGAARRDVLGMVLSQSLRPVAIGLVAGVAGAAAFTQSMGKMLYGVKAADPSVLTGAAALLGLVAVGAAMIPANRAARVDPLTALRQD